MTLVEERNDRFDALLHVSSAFAGSVGRHRLQSSFADPFPKGWREHCQALTKQLSLALSPLLPRDCMEVQYAAAGTLLKIDVSIVPRLPVPVQSELGVLIERHIAECQEMCPGCGARPPVECGCQAEAVVAGSLHTVFTGPFMSNDHVWTSHDDRSKSRLAATSSRLRKAGAERTLAQVIPEWSAKLDELAARFPNFAAVVQTTLRSHLALLAVTDRTRLDAILLVGPPGIGKTHFASALATELFATPFAVVNVAEETNGSSLCGSSTFWSNSKPGRLFELLAWGKAADPLILLDEMDKGSARQDHDPLAGLYALLEANTAPTFQDQSIPDLFIDTSHVRWIGTANSTSGIPAPLLSRLQVFHIEPPTDDQHLSIAQGMLRAMVSTLAIQSRFGVDLPSDVEEELVSLSPRQVRRALQVAIGLSVDSGASSLTLEAWRRACPRVAARAMMGFVA